MHPSKDDLSLLVSTIWSTLLGLTVGPALRPPPAGERLHGRVAIDGAWMGTATLEGPVLLARKVAAIMLAKRAEETSRDDLRDAWAELTNITGGNLKAVLPPSCSLHLPDVCFLAEEATAPNEGDVILEGAFDCDGETFLVTLQRATAKPPH